MKRTKSIDAPWTLKELDDAKARIVEQDREIERLRFRNCFESPTAQGGGEVTFEEWDEWIKGQGGISHTPKADIQAILADWKAEREKAEARIKELEIRCKKAEAECRQMHHITGR